MTMGRFEVYRSEEGFYWLFIGSQGQFLGRSVRHYRTRDDCLASIYEVTAGGVRIDDRSDHGPYPLPRDGPLPAEPPAEENGRGGLSEGAKVGGEGELH